jgi:hypothetical protein
MLMTSHEDNMKGHAVLLMMTNVILQTEEEDITKIWLSLLAFFLLAPPPFHTHTFVEKPYPTRQKELY